LTFQGRESAPYIEAIILGGCKVKKIEPIHMFKKVLQNKCDIATKKKSKTNIPYL